MFSIHNSHGHILKPFLLKSSSLFIHFIHKNTTSPSADRQLHFIVDYLVNSLNFSKQEAISASTKVRHLKSTKNSQSVIEFLRSYNLSESEVKSVVISQPDILLRNVDKSLKPRFNILSEIGFSGSDLAEVVRRDPNLLVRSLDGSIIPAINYLRRILGSKEKIVKVMKRSCWPLYGRFFRCNVMVLEKYGVNSKDVARVILRSPRLLTQNPARLEEKIVQVEREFGITPGSTTFSYGLSTICSMKKLNLQKKFELFKSYGWHDSDILTIAKSQPTCFTHSEERLSKGLDFFMKEVGDTPSWLATRGSLLMYSLEKRVKPRFEVYKVLNEKEKINRGFHPLLCLPDIDFAKQVLYRHKDDIPNHLYDHFTKKLKSQ